MLFTAPIGKCKFIYFVLYAVTTQRSCAGNQRFCNLISRVKIEIAFTEQILLTLLIWKRCNFEPEMQDFAVL